MKIDSGEPGILIKKEKYENKPYYILNIKQELNLKNFNFAFNKWELNKNDLILWNDNDDYLYLEPKKTLFSSKEDYVLQVDGKLITFRVDVDIFLFKIINDVLIKLKSLKEE